MVITLFIGSSFALWKVTIYQETSNKIESGCFQLTFNDASTPSINLSNAYPISDENGRLSDPYTFTIANNCTVDAKYTIYLNTFKASALKTANKISDELIHYHLVKDGGTEIAEQTLNKNTNINTLDLNNFKDKDKIDTSYIISDGSLKGGVKSETGVITPGDSVTYSLRLWIDSKGCSSTDTTICQAKYHLDNTYGFEAQVASIAYATTIK